MILDPNLVKDIKKDGFDAELVVANAGYFIEMTAVAPKTGIEWSDMVFVKDGRFSEIVDCLSEYIDNFNISAEYKRYEDHLSKAENPTVLLKDMYYIKEYLEELHSHLSCKYAENIKSAIVREKSLER